LAPFVNVFHVRVERQRPATPFCLQHDGKQVARIERSGMREAPNHAADPGAASGRQRKQGLKPISSAREI